MLRAPVLIALLGLPLIAGWTGCVPASPATLAVNATPAGATTAAPVAKNQYIGRVSCAAAGCHGFHSGGPADWSNAYHVWDSADPHRWAFDVLYSERSYQIYALLEQPTGDTVDKTTYLKFLVNRCVGCHATPPVKTGLTSAGTPVRFTADEPEDFSQGVSCESCHGPAGGWEGQHFLLSWKEQTTEQRAGLQQAHGFQDLRPLKSRAAVCLKCHVGPQVFGDGPTKHIYDVNHDLIAAGHPRLNFEFNAYLSNLPKHWAEAVVWKQQGVPVPADFHFESWRVGQDQKIKQVAELQAHRPTGKWAEFANHDCRECHHAIGEPNFVYNKRVAWTPDQLKATPAATLVLGLMAASAKPAGGEPVPGFDEAVDLYLAANAMRQDREASSPEMKAAAASLIKAVNDLRDEIGQQHADQGGKNQYDLIDGFNPQTENFRSALQSLQDELEKLSQK